jgi:hypothetical protein
MARILSLKKLPSSSPKRHLGVGVGTCKDGTVYIADREYRRVQMFTKEGKFVKQCRRYGEHVGGPIRSE